MPKLPARNPTSIGRTGRIVLILLAAASLALLSACRTARTGAQTKLLQVGALGFGNPTDLPWIPASMQAELGARGYVEGKNIHVEWRWADGHADQLPALAAELMQLHPDILFGASDLAAAALHAATSTIPIAFAACDDPVRQGFVASLAHPGGNMTGETTSCGGSLLEEKRIELLKAIVPSASRLAVVWYPAASGMDTVLSSVETTAQKLGLAMQPLEVQTPDDLPGAFDAADAGHADLLLILSNSFAATNRVAIANLALQHKLPSATLFSQYAVAGGLLAYGPNLFDDYRLAWGYVDRIHKGAKPADLPVEQPTTFEFVINLQTAQTLGITIPDSVLAQATDVIR